MYREQRISGRQLLKRVFFKTLPVLSGYIVLGIGFGILLQRSGYGIGWALAMSLLIYAGSMQFVGIGLLTSGASLLTAAVTTLMVNARHLFYGISMIERYKGAGRKKPYLIFALTDETYALVSDGAVPDGADPYLYRFLISLFNHVYWVTGSLIGSILGAALPFQTAGIEFSMTALFITVFVEQWLTSPDHRPALTGLFASAGALLLFGPSDFLIPAMLLITVMLTVLRGALEKGGAA